MNPAALALTAIAVLLALIVAAWFLKRQWGRHRLRGNVRTRVLEQWKRASAQTDPHRRLLEADAVLDLALTGLGYRGTLGDKLKKARPYIPEIDAVWRAHKLRNQIAHEAGIRIPERMIQDAMRTYERTVVHFCR